MIAHVTLHVNDFEKGKEFYSKALAPLGYKIAHEFPKYKAIGFISGEGWRDFWLKADGAKQLTHVAFAATSEKMARDFYKAALGAGGKDNGKPGYRAEYGAGYYGAFVLDPDSHNIEAMFWNESK